MPLKFVRNDITKMNTEAVVNTANEEVLVGTGCDSAIYMAAGFDELLQYRKTNIGPAKEGEVFITPGFKLTAKYIIHAVSPCYINGKYEEEEKLRSCYKKSLQLAKDNNIKSISFPLISTGGFGYPKEEGIRIAVDEITAFLLENEMDIYLVVFGEDTTKLGSKLYPDLEEYIDQNYVSERNDIEYGRIFSTPVDKKPETDEFSDGEISRKIQSELSFPRNYNRPPDKVFEKAFSRHTVEKLNSESDEEKSLSKKIIDKIGFAKKEKSASAMPQPLMAEPTVFSAKTQATLPEDDICLESAETEECLDFEELHESKLEERMKHISDTYSQYLLYLIKLKNMENAEVYKRALVDKKIFSKIKNNIDYHPQKITALCLCVGAKLNLDETRDLLARAGYALSPCDKTDIIFSYFIENRIYDMIEIDIQLEEHGLPCIIA